MSERMTLRYSNKVYSKNAALNSIEWKNSLRLAVKFTGSLPRVVLVGFRAGDRRPGCVDESFPSKG